MDRELIEQIALHRWGVIAEAANPRLTPADRGLLVRAIAARAHAHPDAEHAPVLARDDRSLAA